MTWDFGFSNESSSYEARDLKANTGLVYDIKILFNI